MGLRHVRLRMERLNTGSGDAEQDAAAVLQNAPEPVQRRVGLGAVSLICSWRSEAALRRALGGEPVRVDIAVGVADYMDSSAQTPSAAILATVASASASCRRGNTHCLRYGCGR